MILPMVRSPPGCVFAHPRDEGVWVSRACPRFSCGKISDNQLVPPVPKDFEGLPIFLSGGQLNQSPQPVNPGSRLWHSA